MSGSRDTPSPKASAAGDAPEDVGRVCPFCETDTPPLGAGETRHRACADAWGCDYDPVDGHDARAWLDRRAAWIEAETEAGRLETAKIPVSGLLLHPDLTEEGH